MKQIVALRLLGALSVLSLLSACGERPAPPVSPPAQQSAAPQPSEPEAALATRILGASRNAPSCGVGTSLPQEVLQRINRVRATGYRCGWHSMGAAAPLKWDPSLYSAAQGHSLDMAQRNYFDHQSPEGRDVAARVAARHYHWQAVGENIAAGNHGVDAVMQGWLDSPHHCENMLDPNYNDVAVACVAQPGSQWGTYWTMVLGHRR